MPSATLTTREVKNKTTGIDISIPTYKETPTLLASTVDFNVVVVSRLNYFKSPKHKESDVVQFMIPRKYPDFEQLYQQLGEQFPATILPPLPKKVLRLTEAVIKDRKSKLESFLKFLACTPKMSTSSKLLEFLGVNAIKAGRYRKGEVEETDRKQTDRDDQESLDSVIDQDVVTMDTEEDLFGEEVAIEDTEDIFTPEDVDDSLSSDYDTQAARAETKLFDDSDLGGALEEGEAELLGFVPDARVSDKSRSLATVAIDDEDSDLLRIDDDLDKLLVIDRTKAAEIQTEPSVTMATATSSDQVTQPSSKNQKPMLPVKPSPPGKPTISKKPSIGEKPKIPGKKPTLPRKPSKESTDVQTQQQGAINTSNKEDNSKSSEEKGVSLGDDDILKYIQDNSAAGDEDLDLFS